LFRYLPEDDQHRDGLVQILSSPGFREQVDILNAGLRSPYAVSVKEKQQQHKNQ